MSQHYICERCQDAATMVHHKKYITPRNIDNPDITLSWNNLEALCQECHNKEHHRNAALRRYTFDASGNMVEA